MVQLNRGTQIQIIDSQAGATSSNTEYTLPPVYERGKTDNLLVQTEYTNVGATVVLRVYIKIGDKWSVKSVTAGAGVASATLNIVEAGYVHGTPVVMALNGASTVIAHSAAPSAGSVSVWIGCE